MLPVFRIGGIDEPHRKIRPGVLLGVGRSGKELQDIEPGFAGEVHHLLAGGAFPRDNHRRNRCGNRIFEQEAELFRGCVQQPRNALARRQHANHNADIVVAFNLVEHHGRTELCRPHHSAASPNVTIDPGEFSHRIYRFVGFDIFLRELLQKFQR